MIKGNFLGAAIVAIIYTVFILMRPATISKPMFVILLVILNALTIVLLAFAFKA